MDISKVRERCLSSHCRDSALSFLEYNYWFSPITETEYKKLRKEIYKEFKI